MSTEESGALNTLRGGPGVDRRSFLRLAGAASVGLSVLLEACGGGTSAPTAPAAAPTAGPKPAAPAAGPTAGAAAAGPTAGAAAAAGAPNPTPASAGTATPARLKLPTYVPAQGLTPDLPPGDTGLQAGYLTYPKNLVTSVPQPPGLGGDVSILVQTQFAPPPPVDQNPGWQAINKALNANVKLQLVPQADYPVKVPAVMAGNDLPDLFEFGRQLNVGGIPEFLKASYADLTPFLSGDAIKEYPNLAAFPTSIWAQAVYGGAISAVPFSRGLILYTWFVSQAKLDAIGASQPKNADDFKRILKEMTRPQSNQWGTGAVAPGYSLVYPGTGGSPQTAMFGVPNNWAVDASGKFTKDIETEQFRAAVDYVRDLYASGVFMPDPPPNLVVLEQALLSGKIGVMSTGWSGYQPRIWDVGIRQNPPLKFPAIRPFSHDGGKPIWHQYPGVNGITAIKKASPERVKELLRILNYLAAPFGSVEYQLLNYGVKDIHFNFDAQGNPVKTQQGMTDLNLSWQMVAVALPVLYDPIDPQFVRLAYADQQAMVQNPVVDPSASLYSATTTSKGGQLMQKFSDGLGEIVTGRSPLSTLDQLVSDWRSTGGEQIRMEFQRAFTDAK